MSYTFPYDRLKLLVFTLASVTLTVAVGAAFVLLFIGEGEAAEGLRETTGIAAHTGATAALATAMVVASGVCLVMARLVGRSGPVLTVDEHGILDRRAGRRVPWRDVRTVALKGRGLRSYIAVGLHRFNTENDRRRARKNAEVRVNVGALRCRAEDVALAIEVCGGYPVQRRD